MPQKFFENTLYSKFIKNIVRNFNIPSIPTIDDGDFIIKDCLYIYRSSFIKCTKTGTLDNRKQYVKSICSNSLKVSNTGNYVSGVNISTADYTELDFFRLGLNYNNMTERYVSKTSFYDSPTHRYLGTILRAVRDLLHIDLMPFYNCYASETANINILNGIKSKDVLGNISYNPPFCEIKYDRRYKTLIVPVKFNKTYTIALESQTEVKVCPVIYKDGDLIKNENGEIYSNFISTKPLVVGNTNFRMPITYKVDNRDYKLQTLEKYLYLAIQIDSSINTSVVVLEGDYTNQSYKVYNKEYIDNLNYRDKDRLFLSKLSLLQISDGNIYAFSDRLIEYLMLNVITPFDEITENIKRVQNYISDPSKKNNYINIGDNVFMPYDGKPTGVWDEGLRPALFELYMNRGSNKVDITGYVDKDVEKYITQGFDV